MKDQLVALLFPTGIYRPWMWKHITGPAEIGPIWFLVSLFWCRLVAGWICHKGFNLWIIVIVGLLATLLDNFVINLPFGILPGLSAMVFFVIGYFFSSHSPSPWLVALCIISWPLAICFSNIGMSHCHYVIYPLDIVGACGGTLVFWFISRLFERVSPSLSNGLAWIGRATVSILCIHTVLLNCYVLEHIPLPAVWYIQLPYEITVILFLTWICSRVHFTRRFFGIQ